MRSFIHNYLSLTRARELSIHTYTALTCIYIYIYIYTPPPPLVFPLLPSPLLQATTTRPSNPDLQLGRWDRKIPLPTHENGDGDLDLDFGKLGFVVSEAGIGDFRDWDMYLIRGEWGMR